MPLKTPCNDMESRNNQKNANGIDQDLQSADMDMRSQSKASLFDSRTNRKPVPGIYIDKIVLAQFEHVVLKLLLVDTS